MEELTGLKQILANQISESRSNHAATINALNANQTYHDDRLHECYETIQKNHNHKFLELDYLIRDFSEVK